MESDCLGTVFEMITVLGKRLSTFNFDIPPKILGPQQLADDSLLYVTALFRPNKPCFHQLLMPQFHFLESTVLIIDLPEFSPTFKKMWREISIVELGLLEKSDCGMKLPSV